MPRAIETKDGYCLYRLSGHGSLDQASSKIIKAITWCREEGMRKLLVDARAWTGHAQPDIFERFNVARAFAQASRSQVKVALIVRPELMDPDKFEVLVAKNRGLTGNVFDSEPEALAWLLA